MSLKLFTTLVQKVRVLSVINDRKRRELYSYNKRVLRDLDVMKRMQRKSCCGIQISSDDDRGDGVLSTAEAFRISQLDATG